MVYHLSLCLLHGRVRPTTDRAKKESFLEESIPNFMTMNNLAAMLRDLR
jgi:hypothetical protein